MTKEAVKYLLDWAMRTGPEDHDALVNLIEGMNRQAGHPIIITLTEIETLIGGIGYLPE